MKIYNSLTFKKEEFKTILPNEVLMYVCGPTVYDNSHLGHAKSAVSFDVIRRFLEFKGFKVKLVKNYTDIDDKIIKRANEEKVDYRKITEKYIKEYEDIMKILNIKKDFKNPRATEIVDFMIEIILSLISKGYAYETNGSVYYSVKKFPKYKTVLINISEEEKDQEVEEREEFEIISEDEKLNRKDFALWKKSKENEPYWESPWGKGRPGWHIECSAMAIKLLGETIDIHGGGQDLKFPHHRNEIAQSEAYTGKSFANYFIHNGFVKINNEKMSKSLNNFFLVSDIIKVYDPMVLRLFLLSSQYRSSLNYSINAINHAKKQYEKMINTFKKISEIPIDNNESEEITTLIRKIDESVLKIIQAMDDDFNTPIAIAVIMKLLRQINGVVIENKKIPSEKFKVKLFEFFQILKKIFGLFPNLENVVRSWMPTTHDGRGELITHLINLFSEVRSKLQENNMSDLSDNIKKELNIEIADSFEKRGEMIEDLIDLMIKTRNELRKRKLYKISDFIRENLKKLSIVIEDN